MSREPDVGHVHRWRLEEPRGPTSLARCACGAERRMPNSLAIDGGGESAAFDAGGRRWNGSKDAAWGPP